MKESKYYRRKSELIPMYWEINEKRDSMLGEYFRVTDSNESVGTVGTPVNMERE